MNLALFDFDGTITFKDTFTPFVRFAVSRARFAAGGVLLGPLVAGYELGLVRATRLRSAISYLGFRGRRSSEVAALGDRYAQTLSEAIRPKALARIEWHQSQGDQIAVVSASLSVYLRPWCTARGLDLISAELESREGVLTGSYAGGDCSGAEKARRVCARYDLAAYERVYAYGDTEEDRELLHLATNPYFRWRERSAPLSRTTL